MLHQVAKKLDNEGDEETSKVLRGLLNAEKEDFEKKRKEHYKGEFNAAKLLGKKMPIEDDEDA